MSQESFSHFSRSVCYQYFEPPQTTVSYRTCHKLCVKMVDLMYIGNKNVLFMTSPRWKPENMGHVQRNPLFPTSGCAVEVPVPLAPHFQHTITTLSQVKNSVKPPSKRSLFLEIFRNCRLLFCHDGSEGESGCCNFLVVA